MEPRPNQRPVSAQPALTDNARSSPDAVAAASETLDVAAVLLVLQAGFGLVAAVGLGLLTVIAGGAPLYLVALAVGLAGPLLALTLAAKLVRRRRWARRVTVVYEAFILLNAGVRFFFDREVALGLMVTLTSVVLPVLIWTLVVTPSARRATGTGRRRKRNAGALILPLDEPVALPQAA